MAALAFPVAAGAAVPVDRTAWERHMAAHEKLIAEDAKFSEVYDRAWTACQAECQRVPHVVLEPSAHTGQSYVSTADAWYVKRCRSDLANLAAGKMRFDPLPELQEHVRQMRELVDAANARDAAIQRIRDRYGMDDLDDQSDARGDAMGEAHIALMSTPAPDLAALRWKLDHITEEARAKDGSLGCYGHNYVAQLFDDIERLLPIAA
jgi:hypothetical protein